QEQPEQFDVEHPADIEPYFEEQGEEQNEQAAEIDPYIEDAEEANAQAQLEQPEHLDQAAEIDPYVEDAEEAHEQAQLEQPEHLDQAAGESRTSISSFSRIPVISTHSSKSFNPSATPPNLELCLHRILPCQWNEGLLNMENLPDEEYLAASPCARAKRRQDQRNGVAGSSSSPPSPPRVLCLPDYLCGGSSGSSPSQPSVLDPPNYWW
ncbi:hypothetical protein HK102_002661, partial [Quaeritorhiza haematococci]